MRPVVLRCIAGGLGLLVLLVVIAIALFHGSLSRPFQGWEGEQVDVELEAGLDAGSMLRRLAEAGVIRDPLPLRIWLFWNGGSDALHAGEYRFSEPCTPLEILARLQAGEVLLHAVTIPEGLVLEQIAQRLDAAGFGDAGQALELFRTPRLLRDLDPAASDLEGYLFPDTYQFPRHTPAEKIAATMIKRFQDVAGDDYAARAERAGLSLREAVTLASLIEKETSVADERAKISRVFHNRLERGMLLQCDPTVRYALEREGVKVERLTYAHLETVSPWNTYVSPGLPPGPIANPGKASLEAAVEPADGGELYFVAAPGGGHRFSRDLESHTRAVREWRNYLRSSR